MNAPVLAFFNNKGGVGKTSLVYHLAWMLSEMGERVLTCDLDPQANLTASFLEEDQLESLWKDEPGNRDRLPMRGAAGRSGRPEGSRGSADLGGTGAHSRRSRTFGIRGKPVERMATRNGSGQPLSGVPHPHGFLASHAVRRARHVGDSHPCGCRPQPRRPQPLCPDCERSCRRPLGRRPVFPSGTAQSGPHSREMAKRLVQTSR